MLLLSLNADGSSFSLPAGTLSGGPACMGQTNFSQTFTMDSESTATLDLMGVNFIAEWSYPEGEEEAEQRSVLTFTSSMNECPSMAIMSSTEVPEETPETIPWEPVPPR